MGRSSKALAAGLATGLIGALLVATPLGFEFEQDYGLFWLFRIRGVVEPPPEAVVVAIDSETAERIGEVELESGSGRRERLRPKPRDWPRTIHGRLLEVLVAAGAAGVVFDMDFSLPKEARDDARFAEAVFAARRVILFQRLTGKRQPITGADGSTTGWLWVEQTVPPVPALAAAASGIGPFPLPKLDEALYQFWVFKASAGDIATLPALALQLLALEDLDALALLLTRAGVGGVENWPTAEQLRSGVADLQEFMIGLRHALTFEPEHEARARAWLAGSAAQELAPRTRARLEALLELYSGPESAFLSFYGPPGTVRTVPYHAVIAAAVDGDPGALDLAGKIVFVGYSDLHDPGQPDRFYTVFTRDDGVDLSGVEIAATAFANLLTRRTARPMEGPWAAGVLLAFGVLVGALAYRLRAHLAVPCALLLALGHVGLAQWVFSTGSLWLPLATPVLVQLPLALLVGLLGQYLFERRERRRVSDAIGYYLPEQVARDLVEQGADLAAADKTVYATCFATDMAGFTTLGETMAPGDLARFMNAYFEALAEPLKAHAVDVTEFRADAIMCAWTGESAERRIRANAASAALDAVEAIAGFSEREGRPLRSRIGLDAGWVYVGHAGGGGHLTYSIVGDCANTAARIEGLNKKLSTQILASQAVVDGLSGFLMRPLGRFVFVGKSEPIPIVELLAYEVRASSAQRALCERFAEALASFQARRWAEAAERFRDLLDAHPGDGPSRMYLDLCTDYTSAPPAREDLTTVRLETK